MSSGQARHRRGRHRPAQSPTAFQNAFGGFANGILMQLGRRDDGSRAATDEQAMAAGRAVLDGIQGTLDERLCDSDEDSVGNNWRGASQSSTNNARPQLMARPREARVEQAYAMLQSQNRGMGETKSSTEKKINPYYKHWAAFCVANGIMTKDEQKEHLQFLDANKAHDMVKMRKFIQFLDGLPNKLTSGQLETACLFIQTHLNKELAANDKPVINGAVKADPIIKEVLGKYKRSKAERALKEGEDFQSKIATRITKEQMYRMTEQGFNPTDDALRRLHPLSLMNTVAGMRHTHQTGQRGDDLRSFSVSMGFTQVSDYVGPRGTELNYCITNQGKTNKVGKHEYSACAPCVNPMLDTTAWQGYILIYRHGVLAEPMPNLLDWKQYYQLPVYRGASSATARVSGNSQNEHWNKLYKSQDVLVAKVVHQGRVEHQQALDNVGVSQPHISRALHYADKSVSGAQATSYLYNPPLDAVVASAGGDPRNIQHFDPVWNRVPVSEELLSFAMPDLVTQIKAVEEEFNSASTIGERNRKQLCTAQGTARSYKSKVEHALRAAAARPLDVDSKLIADSEPLYLKYRDSFAAFRHPVFSSSQFAGLVEAMRIAQDSQSRRQIQVPPDCRNEFERVTYTDVLPAIRLLQTDMRAGQRGSDTFQLELARQMGRLEKLQEHQTRFNYALWNLLSSFQDMDTAQSDAMLREAMSGVGNNNNNNNGANAALLPRQVAPLTGRSTTSTGETTIGLRIDGITPRKRKPAVSRESEYGSGPGEKRVLMSTENHTLEDFWGEFYHGRAGNPPLKDLEAEGMEWRRDPAGASRFKTFWSYRVPIYNLITHLMETGLSEPEALEQAQPIFDSVPKSRTGKPDMKKLPNIFNAKLKEIGGYDSRKYKRQRRN